MEEKPPQRGGFWWRLGLVLVFPFILETVYLVMTRFPSYKFTEWSDKLSIGAATVGGVAMMVYLFRRWPRISMVVWSVTWGIFLPFALIWCMLFFAVVVCGDSL